MVIDERSDEEPDESTFDVTSGEELVPSAPGSEEDSDESSTEQSTPGVDIPDASDAPAQVRATFWAVVFFVDVAMAGLVMGPVVLIASDMTRLGIILTAVGLLAAGAAYRRYRQFERTPDEELGIETANDESEERKKSDDESGRGDDESGESDDKSGKDGADREMSDEGESPAATEHFQDERSSDTF